MIRRLHGFSLIELITVIVILAVAGVGVVAYINQTTRASADPQMIQQANAIAQSYLEEVRLRAFCDPDFAATNCPVACVSSACGSCSGAEPSRDLFDDVCDYDGLSDTTGALDQTGAVIPGLEDFNVSVDVVDDASADLNGLSATGGRVVMININVSHDGNQNVDVNLTGYRVNF